MISSFRRLLIAATLVAVGLAAHGADMPRVRLETSLGPIVIELDRARAPATVDNFLAYVADGFYDGTVFHRVIADFMIQGGGFTPELERKGTRTAIRNEAGNGLSNVRGSIAMARTSQPHSATAQFFINVEDNPNLDFRAPTQSGFGYAVFGRVVEGMDVVDAIRKVPTGARGPYRDVPTTPVVIERAVLLEE
ncbi:MAG: peptidylprolyl isomerase [Gammaproteobacteria bacterium]|nr:peptidylprolyl isomerase [Gammaproteobacteria bacterium]